MSCLTKQLKLLKKKKKKALRSIYCRTALGSKGIITENAFAYSGMIIGNPSNTGGKLYTIMI